MVFLVLRLLKMESRGHWLGSVAGRLVQEDSRRVHDHGIPSVFD